MLAMKPRWTSLVAIAASLAVSAVSGVAAQDWPARAVLVVSPFAAGSANDTVARIVLDQVGRQLGQAFVIENRPGGGGVVGVASVVRAEPRRLHVPDELGVDELRGDPAPVAAL